MSDLHFVCNCVVCFVTLWYLVIISAILALSNTDICCFIYKYNESINVCSLYKDLYKDGCFTATEKGGGVNKVVLQWLKREVLDTAVYRRLFYIDGEKRGVE